MDFYEVLGIKRGLEKNQLDLALRDLCLFKEVGNKLFVDVSKRFTSIEDALPEIIIQARIYGGTPIPEKWFPSSSEPESMVVLLPSHKVAPELPQYHVTVEKGFCVYSGQSNKFYSALEEFIKFLIEDPSNHQKVGRELWMAVDWCILNTDIGGAIDGVRLLHLLPEGFPDVENIMKEALDSEHLALNISIADQFEFHPIQNSVFIEQLTKLALNAPNPPQAKRLIKALRIIGGHSSFDALLSIARESNCDRRKVLATTALAWTKNLENLEQRFKKLIFSKDRKTSKIASTALSTLKNHSVCSNGAPFATKKERNSM